MQQIEFARRRQDLMKMMGHDAIAIVPAAPQRIRSRDVEYPFRQDSDFHYLTGFPEPEAVAVLVPGREPAEFIMFCRERDPKRETWDGYRAGPEGACSDYGADDAFPIDDIDEILPGLIEKCDRVFYTMGRDLDFDRHLIEWVNRLKAQAGKGMHSPHEIVALDHLLQEMRSIKSSAEIAAMRRAAEITAGAHRRAIAETRPGMREYEIQAELEYEFGRHGTVAAYPPIVGGGANGCVLHYTENRDELADGDLLLVDAGCEFDLYASDVTRTWPVNGRFSGTQRAVYDIVLEAQKQAIDAIGTDKHWNDPHEASVRVLTQGMVDLGLLKGDVDALIEEEAYRRFYMHRVGHWIGIDVHDVGEYKVDGHWRQLEPGMVMTVEPGLYIPAGSEGVDERWWNIGVRIEDDVLLTRNGPEILSREVPTAPDEIEGLMEKARKHRAACA